jgi:hypothetical protein
MKELRNTWEVEDCNAPLLIHPRTSSTKHRGTQKKVRDSTAQGSSTQKEGKELQPEARYVSICGKIRKQLTLKK